MNISNIINYKTNYKPKEFTKLLNVSVKTFRRRRAHC